MTEDSRKGIVNKYKNSMKKSIYYILILFIFTLPIISFAEMQIEVQENEVSIETIPENPQPYDDVTINISSYATDLNKAIITWQTDKGVVLSGIGKTSYSLKALGPNTTIILNISIKPVGSMNTINKKVVISPSEVELVWEAADGYTPLFYKGKSFVSGEGLIKVVAIPNTNTIKSGRGSVVYNWKSGDEALLEATGYNKEYYTFPNSALNNKEEITVTASAVDGQYNATKTITIPIISPKVLFYKKSPTEGILYNMALNSNSPFIEEEMTIVAEPYFLALKGHENEFNYNWKINGDNINTPSKKTELTIRPTSRGGYANISLMMENLNKLFQKVTGQLKLTI